MTNCPVCNLRHPAWMTCPTAKTIKAEHDGHAQAAAALADVVSEAAPALAPRAPVGYHIQFGADGRILPPPDGRQWHKDDWRSWQMHPPYRPLLLGEIPEPGDEQEVLDNWQPVPSHDRRPVGRGWNPHRTTRPLPPPPTQAPALKPHATPPPPTCNARLCLSDGDRITFPACLEPALPGYLFCHDHRIQSRL